MRQESKGQGHSDIDGNCVGCGLHMHTSGFVWAHLVAVSQAASSANAKLPNPPHPSVRWRLCCLHREWSGVELEVDISPSN